MNHYGRRRKRARVNVNHNGICYKPCAVRGRQLEYIIIYDDEIEAVRLADLNSLYQEECAKRMEISRSTFSRLVESARKKIADAILNKKVLKVETRDY